MKGRKNMAVEAAQKDGRYMWRIAHMPPGVWLEEPSSIDAILSHIQRELGIRPGQWGGNLMKLIGMERTAINRYRTGRTQIPGGVLLRLSDYSGIPVDELRMVAGLLPDLQRHPNARTKTARRKED